MVVWQKRTVGAIMALLVALLGSGAVAGLWFMSDSSGPAPLPSVPAGPSIPVGNRPHLSTLQGASRAIGHGEG